MSHPLLELQAEIDRLERLIAKGEIAGIEIPATRELLETASKRWFNQARAEGLCPGCLQPGIEGSHSECYVALA
jgi:hypothetical protein